MHNKRSVKLAIIVLTAALFTGAAETTALISPASAKSYAQAGDSAYNEEFTVFLDAGHGGMDSGGALGRVEKRDNLRMAKAVERELTGMGARVIMARKDDDRKYRGQKDLVKRIRRANKARASVYVSLHRDAMPGSRASGISIFLHKKSRKTCHKGEYPNKHTASPKMARAVMKGLKKTSGLKVRIRRGTGTYKPDYKVNYMTNMPSCLIEMGFMTNPRDNRLFDRRIKQNARAIAEGIMSISSQQQR